MNNLSTYIIEKLHLNKDIDVDNNNMFLLLYEYDFDKKEFDWETFENIEEVFAAVDKKGVYDVYTNVPNDNKFIESFLKSLEDLKFERLSYGKFNDILKKNDIKGISGETILDMTKKWKKELVKKND